MIKLYSSGIDKDNTYKAKHNVTSYCVLDKRQSILLGLNDGSLTIMNSASGTEKITVKKHTKTICWIDKNTEETFFITSEDLNIKIWRFEDLSIIYDLKVPICPITIHLLDDLNNLYMLDKYSFFHFNSVTSIPEILSEKSFFIKSILLTNDKKLIIFYNQSNSICAWNVKTETITFSIKLPDKVYSGCLAISECNQFLLSGCSDFILRLFDLQEKCCKYEFKGHTNAICGVDFRKNTDIAVSSSSNESIVWDLKNKTTIHVFSINTETTLSVSLSSCCNYFVLLSISRYLIFDIKKFAYKEITECNEFMPTVSRFSRDGLFLVSLNGFKEGMIYDLKNESIKFRFKSQSKLFKHCDRDSNLRGLFNNLF